MNLSRARIRSPVVQRAAKGIRFFSGGCRADTGGSRTRVLKERFVMEGLWFGTSPTTFGCLLGTFDGYKESKEMIQGSAGQLSIFIEVGDECEFTEGEEKLFNLKAAKIVAINPRTARAGFFPLVARFSF